MTRNDKIKYGLFAFVAIIFLLLLFSLFRSSTQNSEYKATIKAQDETIKAIRSERDAYKAIDVEKDKSIAAHEQTDSVLKTKSNQVIIKYEKIPSHIMSLNKDSLRRAVSNY